MRRLHQFLCGSFALLMTLMLVGCFGDADPVRQSLNIDSSDLQLMVGETSTRTASSKSSGNQYTYRSSKPSVATVDKNGKVTAMSEGEATITVHMDENRTDWYAAADRSYKVIVKTPATKELRLADRATPMTLVAVADGKITITFNGGITLPSDICYTINASDEQTISRNTQGSYDITVSKDDVVQLYSTNSALSSDIAATRGMTRAVADGAKYISIKPSMKTELYGNLMSLLKGKDNFETAMTIEADNAFYGLFSGAENLTNNTLRHMVLPAITLKKGCYQDMFYGCKGLQRSPDLLANKLVENCYKEMFYDCSKLSFVECLASDISATDCMKNWLANAGSEVSSEKTVATIVPFPTDSNDGVPTDWNNLVVTAVTGISLDKSVMLLELGSSATSTLTATVTPEYAYDKTVSWSSSNESVATVNSSGVVTAKGKGSTTITASAGGKSATCSVVVINMIDLSTLTADYEAQDGDFLVNTLGDYYKVSIANGATVVLKDANISLSERDNAIAGLTCSGDATIILMSQNTVKALGKKVSGIFVPQNHTLTIKGDGSLTVNGGSTGGAGIGASYEYSCGAITIQGGTITAKGGANAAGIGSCYKANCDAITISGGTVTASGGQYGAGIGAGQFGVYKKITIKDGTIDATGGSNAAGIGAGPIGWEDCGDIEISGGKVKATGGSSSAGIGTGYSMSVCGKITISGGETEATGQGGAAAIGSGSGDGEANDKCGDITITSSVKKVSASKGSAATYHIGRGNNSGCGTVTVGDTSYGTNGVTGGISYTYQP